MTQLKHTPGPWLVIERSDDWMTITDNPSMSVGFVDVWDFDYNEKRLEANANLIAAAPELLKHLEWAVSCLHFDPDDLPEAAQKLNAALAAIAKATGQS